MERKTFKVNYNVARRWHCYTVDGIDCMADFHFEKSFYIPDGWDIYESQIGEMAAITPYGECAPLVKFFREGKTGNCYLQTDSRRYKLEYVEGSDGPEIYHNHNY